MSLMAIAADRLVTGRSDGIVDEAMVVVDGDTIVAAGPRRTVSPPRGATLVDGTGCSLLPGLIDAHVHLFAKGCGVDFADQLGTPPSLALLRIVKALRATLDAGFTTVRDAGGAPAGVRRAIEEGIIAGPRLQLALSILGPTGGHTDNAMPCGLDLQLQPIDVPPFVVDGVSAVQQRIREVVRAGADWVKLCASGGIVDGYAAQPGFSLRELRAGVAEAAARGRPVMVHALTAAAIKNAVRAGAASVEHAIWIDDEAIQMMVERGVALVPTLVAPEWVVRHGASGRMPDHAVALARQAADDHRAGVGRAIAAGVRVVLGTDAGVGPHGANGGEFSALHRAGMEPIDAIRAATGDAALLLGLQDRVGTLSHGMLADLILVDGDPLRDIGVLADPDRVALVMIGGAVLKDRRGLVDAELCARRRTP